jgi:phage terminase large subunit-like protein
LHWSNLEFGKHVDAATKQPLPDPENYVRMFVQPEDNRANLTAEYIDSLKYMSAKQRKRFYEGVYSEEVDGALWTYERLDMCRVERVDMPTMRRIIVAVDPSGARGEEDERSDEIGIVAIGLGSDERGYVLEDATMKGSPAEWARMALNVYGRHGADAIVYERNYGGAIVENAMMTSVDYATGVKGRNVSYHEVTVFRGKWLRAEPVSALYDATADKMRHVGRFPDLEDELCMFSGAGYTGARSPNRADALVMGATFLLLDDARPEMVISDAALSAVSRMSRVAH